MIEHNGLSYATTAQAGQQLRDAGAAVTNQRVRDWARRGLIESVARLDDGQRVYRMDDVWAVERDTRKSRPSTQRLTFV